MLRLVRDDDDGGDWDDDGTIRPPRRDEYSGNGRVNVAALDYPTRSAARARKRSAFARVALSLLIALLLATTAGTTYLAYKGGALDGVIAGWLAAAPPQPGQPVAASAPAPAPAPQSPEPAAGPAIPQVEGLVILVRSAVMALHQANVTGNYTVLREMAAPNFQQANSPAALSEAFADLRGRDLDLSSISVANPVLSGDPTITDAGLLRLAGFFPVGNERVNFDLLFQRNDGRWQIFGIGVFPGTGAEAKPPSAGPATAPVAEPGKLPEPAAMIALIRGAVLALNQANRTGNYAVLREMGAQGFRDGNSLAQLGAIFGELRGRNLDLAPVAVIEPRLFRPAAIDQQGYLRLTGYFPSRPEQVNFDLAFQINDGEWRLFGIGVNTSVEIPAAAAAAPEAASAGAAPLSGAGESPALPAGSTAAPGAATPGSGSPPAATTGPTGSAPAGKLPPTPRLRPRS